MKFRAKKHFGQNFLVDENAVNQIIEVSKIKKEDDVIEIGPGTGALTKNIVKKCNSFIAYEIDNNLFEYISNLFESENVKIFNQDFLKANLEWEGKKLLIANIPYNLTSDILFKIFYNKHLFKRAIIMVQKEVADRITAECKSSSYGKFSLVCEYFSTPKQKIFVKRSSFNPMPKVDSVVLEFKFKETKYEGEKQKKFLRFLADCFTMRRKTIINNFKRIDINLDQEELESMEIFKNTRPQELTLKQYIVIFDRLFDRYLNISDK